MKNRIWNVLGAGLLLCGLCGCLSSGYRGESFPATGEVTVLPRAEKPPEGYTLIGRGWVSGEASATTRRELEQRMVKLAEQHGADAMVVMGMVLVPAGREGNDAASDTAEASDDFDQYHTQVAFNQDVGDYSATNSATRFVRKLYADFFRRKASPAKP